MESTTFAFGPGEWQLMHNPKMTTAYEYHRYQDDCMFFYLNFGGQVDNKKVKRTDSQHKSSILTWLFGKGKKVDNKEVKESNSADKFSLFAKLSIMKTDGKEYASACKLFCFHSAIVKILRIYL